MSITKQASHIPAAGLFPGSGHAV